jgi:hypothetical protein
MSSIIVSNFCLPFSVTSLFSVFLNDFKPCCLILEFQVFRKSLFLFAKVFFVNVTVDSEIGIEAHCSKKLFFSFFFLTQHSELHWRIPTEGQVFFPLL